MSINCADLSFEGNIRDSQIGTLVFSVFFDQESHIITNIGVWTLKNVSCIIRAVGSLVSVPGNSWFIMLTSHNKLTAQLVYDRPIIIMIFFIVFKSLFEQ